MKYLILLSYLFLSTTQVSSCQQHQEEVKAVVDEFVQAMYKPVNFKKMKSLYDGFPFMSVARAAAHEIKSMKKSGKAVIVDVHSHWTTSKGEKIINDFLLKLEKKEGVWKIVNSKKLSAIKDMYPEAYQYALTNKMLDEGEDLWDVELQALLKKANKLRKQN